MSDIITESAFALPQQGTAAVEGKDPGHDPVQKITVVGDRDDYAREMVQIILQNLQGLDIQVIGRFIQDQDIRILHQDTEQTQPPLFAAGQLADRRVLHFRIK